MEVVPSRSWSGGVKAVRIDLRLLKDTMDFLGRSTSYIT